LTGGAASVRSPLDCGAAGEQIARTTRTTQ
jgi:hypothetical protein